MYGKISTSFLGFNSSLMLTYHTKVATNNLIGFQNCTLRRGAFNNYVDMKK